MQKIEKAVLNKEGMWSFQVIENLAKPDFIHIVNQHLPHWHKRIMYLHLPAKHYLINFI